MEGSRGIGEATEKDKAKLADLRKKLGTEVMYSLPWLEIQEQIRDLSKKIYGPEKSML